MTYDELGTLAVMGRGIIWDSKDSTGGMGMWVALTQQGPTSFAAQSSRCVPALAPGNRAHWGFGEADDGVQEAESSPRVPRDQLVSLRKCHGVLLLLPSLCAVPPQQYGATVKPSAPSTSGQCCRL